jgi:hypothetical protein
VTGGKPIAVLLQSISGVSAINPLVALRHPWKKERGAILLFCPGYHTRLYVTYVAIFQVDMSTRSTASMRARRGHKERSKNFTELEKRTVLELIARHRDVLRQGRSNNATNRSKQVSSLHRS